MSKVFVLINCHPRNEKSVIEKLTNLNDVKEARGILGIYDIMATIESDQDPILKGIVANQIRKINQINSTLTLFSADEDDSELIPDIIPDEKKPLEPPDTEGEYENDEDEDMKPQMK